MIGHQDIRKALGELRRWRVLHSKGGGSSRRNSIVVIDKAIAALDDGDDRAAYCLLCTAGGMLYHPRYLPFAAMWWLDKKTEVPQPPRQFVAQEI